MSYSFADLPTELIHKIFSYLNSTDLARSCMVSKRWRSIGNSDVLWKRLCEQDDIFEAYIDSKKIPSVPANGQTLDAMNKWALLYGAFTGELVRNWKSDKYGEVKLDSSVEHITIRKGWMFHSFYNHGTVDVYRLEGKVFKRVQRLRPLIPNEGSLFLSYNCETLTITSNNIVVIYLNTNREFIFERVIALDSCGVKTTFVDKEAFMAKIFSHTLLIFCTAIFKEHIWLFNEFSREVVIINRKTGNIERTIDGENHFACFSINEKQLVVVAKNGIFSFYPNGIEKISMKDQPLSHKKNIIFNSQYVSYIDDTSNDSLVFINLTYWTVNRYEFANPLCIALHSELPLAYIVNYVNNRFFLQSISILTGELIWSEVLSLPTCQSQQNLMLVVILNRYLLLFPIDRAGEEVGCLDPLCKWAFVYSDFLLTVTRNWMDQTCSEIVISNSVLQVVFHKIWMFQALRSHTMSVDVFQLKDKVFQKLQSIKISDKNYGINCLYAVQDSLFISFNNIIVIYEYINGKFQYEKAIAVTETTINQDMNSLDTFIKEFHSYTCYIIKITLVKKYVWISSDICVLVIDRDTSVLQRKIMINSSSFLFFSTEKQFNLVSLDTVTSYSANATILQSTYISQRGKGSISFTSKYFGFIDEDRFTPVIVNLSTGRVNVFKIPNSYSLTLNKKLPYVYILSLVGKTFSLNAMAIPSGDYLWSKTVDVPVQKKTSFMLYTILNKYLLLFYLSDKKYNFDIYSLSSGKHLCTWENEQPFYPVNNIMLKYPNMSTFGSMLGIDKKIKCLL